MIEIGTSLDKLASGHAYRKTPNYLVMGMAGFVTFMITEIVWFWIISTSISDEGKYRHIRTYFTTPFFIVGIAIPFVLFYISIFIMLSNGATDANVISGTAVVLLVIGRIASLAAMMHDINALCKDHNAKLNQSSNTSH